MARRKKTYLDDLVPVSLKTLATYCVGYQTPGLNLERGQLSCYYIAETSLNVTLNHNQPTNQLRKRILLENNFLRSVKEILKNDNINKGHLWPLG